MNDDQLRDALRSLPRHRPRDGFSRRVLHAARSDAAPARRRAARRAAAVAAAVLLGLLVVAVPELRRPRTPRIEELRAERARLAAELEEIKRLAHSLEGRAEVVPAPGTTGASRGAGSTAEPVLYLGGNERIDLVLDLSHRGQTEGDLTP